VTYFLRALSWAIVVELVAAGTAAGQCPRPWQPWRWPKKFRAGRLTIYGGQRFSLIDDRKADSLYLRNYDLALFMDDTLSEDQQLRAYIVLNPRYRKHPQVRSGFWPIYFYWQKTFGDGCLQVGKVPVPFNYRNGFPEWHSQVRRVTRSWDWGVRWRSKIRHGLQWDFGIFNDGTSPAAKWSDSDEPAWALRIRTGVDKRFEFGVSALEAHNRTVPNVGRVHDITRHGAHFRWTPSPRFEMRGEYVDFRSLTQCGPMSPVYADKPGHGWVLEALYQPEERWQVFLNYNSLTRDETTASTVRTLTVGGRYKLSNYWYLIPELWFVDDDLPRTNPMRDDDRYILTLLFLF